VEVTDMLGDGVAVVEGVGLVLTDVDVDGLALGVEDVEDVEGEEVEVKVLDGLVLGEEVLGIEVLEGLVLGLEVEVLEGELDGSGVEVKVLDGSVALEVGSGSVLVEVPGVPVLGSEVLGSEVGTRVEEPAGSEALDVLEIVVESPEVEEVAVAVESVGEGRVVSVVSVVDAVDVAVTVTVGSVGPVTVGTLVVEADEVAGGTEVVELVELGLGGHGERTVGRPSGQTPRGVSQVNIPKKQPICSTSVGATISIVIANWSQQGSRVAGPNE
jgi:hypothetical protein